MPQGRTKEIKQLQHLKEWGWDQQTSGVALLLLLLVGDVVVRKCYAFLFQKSPAGEKAREKARKKLPLVNSNGQFRPQIKIKNTVTIHQCEVV